MPDRTFPQIERRKELQLSDEHIEQIAERAAEKAVKKMTDQVYKAVGKSVLQKLFYITGAIAVAGYFWLQSKGLLPK